MSNKTFERTYDHLHLCSLTAEQRARTCSYWYVVTGYGGSPHTAFRTRRAVVAWLERLGLEAENEIPTEGEWASIRIRGSYKRVSHWGPETFTPLDGLHIRVLDNARWTLGIVTTSDDGVRSLHHLNCNTERPEFDYRESCALEDAGANHA